LTLLVKDANTTTQPISTQTDVAGNLVPVHAPAAVVGGIATPVGPTAPLPVINTGAAAAIDGSATVIVGGTAQTLFAGVVPTNGYLVANNSSTTDIRKRCWCRDIWRRVDPDRRRCRVHDPLGL
jgi:hypothetical protein